MKYKVRVIVGILTAVITVVVGCSVSQIRKEHLKKENEQMKEENERLVEKAYEELISFCKNNQADIEQLSIEINDILKKGTTINDVSDLISHISSPAWKQLSERLYICYPIEFDQSYDMAFYQDCANHGDGPYSLYVVYFDESEEKIQDYLKGRFIPPSRYTKISDHLYVCLFEKQLV